MPNVTLIAVDMPVRDAALDVARQARVSVIAPSSEATVSLELSDVSAEEAFRRIGQSAELGVSYRSGIVSFTGERDEKEVFAVLDPGYAEPTEALDAFSTILGSQGEVRSVNGRIAYGGTREGLRRALDVASGFRNGPDGWLLRVVVFEVSDRIERQLGVDLALGASLDATGGDVAQPVDTPFFAPALSGIRAAFAVAALASLSEDGSESRIRTSGTLYLLEGEPARLNQGERVPIPRRTVSPEGTVETAGFDYVETGFTLQAQGVRVPTGLRLTLEPTLSSVTGFVEDAPIFNERSVEGVVVVDSGEWVLLSGLSRQERSQNASGVPGLPSSYLTDEKRDTLSESSIIIAVHVQRVTRGVSDNDLSYAQPID
ncbi:MAG: hypothetical protein AAFY15_06965 [Cyanobacteria bacterium J06648_11]